MTIIKLLLLMASAMTNVTESKSLVQVEMKTTCGIRRLDTFDMMLTCYFHDNISALQKDFTVYHYKEQQQSPKTVVSCHWTPEVSCYVALGYKYDDDIVVHHDHTNVRLLHATIEHVGMYTCQVMGDSDPGTCSLTEEEIPRNSTLTPNTQLTSMTVPAQTTTSSLPDDRQTQSADEQSSADNRLLDPEDAPGGSLAEDHKQTGSLDNTVVVVVLFVVLSVLLIIIIIAVLKELYWRRRQRRSSTMVNEGSDKKDTQAKKTLLKSLNGEAETTTTRKSKKRIKDGESSPGAQVTSPTESSINIRSHVHSQPLE